MDKCLVIKRLSDISPVLTSHGIGEKRVLASGLECDSNTKQVAVAKFDKGCFIDKHVHPDMEEFYFILNGAILFTIEDKNYSGTKDDFIKIPAGTDHSLKALKKTKAIYWGVSINDK